MDGELYTTILGDELMKTIDWYGKNPSDIIFEQDNDPKHTCKKAKEWFKNSGIEVLPCPAQSPDLNPIDTSGNSSSRGWESTQTPQRDLGTLGEGGEGVGRDTSLKMQGFGGEHA